MVKERRPFDPATDGTSTLTKDWLRVRIDPEPPKKPAELEGRIVSFNLARFHKFGPYVKEYQWFPSQLMTEVSRRGPDDHLRVRATTKPATRGPETAKPMPFGSCDFDFSLAEYGVDWVLLSGTPG